MKCPSCGADNDGSNRFCEQCGARLDAAPPPAASQTCPSCGAVVLPGEAFCDECGAALNNPAPVAASLSDAPTIQAPAAPAAASVASNGQNITCPACGHQNLPGDQFCDNCGAALDQPAAAPSPAPAAQPAAPAPSPAPAAPVPSPALPDAPTVEQPMISADNSDAMAAYQAEQQRLNDEIGRQQKIIEQFEQMQSMFGAATPPAVTQGLADARSAKSASEAALAALAPPAPPAPPVDPAELARLNDEIGRQQKIIEQFEQMQSMFGAATPPAVTQGLADARAAKAASEASLAALQGGAPTPTPPVPPANVPQPAKPDDAPPQQQTTTVDVPDEPAPPPPPPLPAPEQAPAAPPQPSAAPAPRLVFDDGKELPLPTDRREVIVGREDPISGIFPEIDLTPHGGETGGVSRQHAKLTHADGSWSLTDLHSTNYTRVDGARLEPDVPTPLKSGARLQFGRVAMTFQI